MRARVSRGFLMCGGICVIAAFVGWLTGSMESPPRVAAGGLGLLATGLMLGNRSALQR